MSNDSIYSYTGNTFVGFLDMSGFKNMMTNNIAEASISLSRFYNALFYTGIDYHNSHKRNDDLIEINVIAISDSAIIFPRLTAKMFKDNRNLTLRSGLKSLLTFLKSVNEDLIQHNILTTTSIAFGKFGFQNRPKGVNIIQNFVIGDGYLQAYRDYNQNPKLNPGECRILMNSLPDTNFLNITEGLFRHLTRINDHFYFFWIKDIKRLESFRGEYQGILEKGDFPRLSELFKKYLR